MLVEFVGINDPILARKKLLAIAADRSAVLPRLILLDLNMPRMRGGELLAFIRGEPRLRDIPVVILTTSNAADDRSRSLALGASEYQVKPFRLEAYLTLFRTFCRYLDEPGEGGGGGEPPEPMGGPPTASGPSGMVRGGMPILSMFCCWSGFGFARA